MSPLYVVYVLSYAGCFFPKVGSGMGSLVGLAQAARSPGPLVAWSCGSQRPPVSFLAAAAREKLEAGLENEICDEPEWPNEGACLRYVMSLGRQVRGHVFGYMVKRNRHMKGRV